MRVEINGYNPQGMENRPRECLIHHLKKLHVAKLLLKDLKVDRY